MLRSLRSRSVQPLMKSFLDPFSGQSRLRGQRESGCYCATYSSLSLLLLQLHQFLRALHHHTSCFWINRHPATPQR
ncbi:hypothetical protein BO83DRAFT_52332 [Aspergillus eucalypticola CBS 122712]|uniref:Uncharacterized protein n=1 Tax=Aspergillus eucalypticola (strain CBS 122712 / IBT 29274) TaxID=1448314 RepID=A0A317VAL4_ASPEC|nr:uncharacterized protein BO83DRAFT_52332 [Aspergillus eucalypticola CBS 122712]PWY71384.1 hypothetical protein BO83DRAFT_52332 [Aspergillus eucalypticola CBS 122712]